jgi:hypothetical protein
MLFACALLLHDPEGFAASPLHPTTLACAHVVVLGFLVTQIAGAFHVAAPLALRTRTRADWRDGALLVAILVAASGVASHMALGTYSGVAWSGGLLVAALALRVPGWWLDLANAPAPAPIRVGIAVAWLGLLATASLGLLLAVDRTRPFLPGGHAHALAGHAHLGAGGFVLLMVVAFGQRLLPMFLPAAPPPLWTSWTAVGGVAIGAFGLGMTLPSAPAHAHWFAVPLAAGVAAFLLQAIGMLRARKPAPADQPRPDATLLLAATAMVALLLALVLGTALAAGIATAPGAQTAYGVLALLGCFGSLSLALGHRLLPLAGWHAAWHDQRTAAIEPPAPPRRVGTPWLLWLTAVCWPLGCGTLAVAAFCMHGGSAAIGGWLLSLAVAADLANVLRGWQRRHRAAT